MEINNISQVKIESKDLTTANRFVVFLDIMGFKNMVARQDHKEVLEKLQRLQKDISFYVSLHKMTNVQLAQFSDSIVLFSQDVSKDSFQALADIAASIMMTAIQQGIPLKGAIAKGKITCDIPKQLFFGQALIDAYLLEENIKYYGVVVHHTAENDARKDKHHFRDMKVYLKSGQIAHFELNWYNKQLDNIPNQYNIERCLSKIRQTVSDEPRKYIDNTLQIVKEGKNVS